MTESNQVKSLAPLEALFCFLALIGVVAVGYAAGRTIGVDAGRHQGTAREHYEREKKNALRVCAGSEGAAAVECGSKAVEIAQENSEGQQALYAQQDAARWSYWSMLAAWIALVVTALGVWFVKRTLDATLEAVQDTSAATVAMIRQNELTEQAHRPWLSLEILEINEWANVQGSTIFGAILEVKNTGQSPAVAARCAVVQELRCTISPERVDKTHLLRAAAPQKGQLVDWFALVPGQVMQLPVRRVVQGYDHEGRESDLTLGELMIGVVYKSVNEGSEFYTIQRVLISAKTEAGHHGFYRVSTLMR